MEVDITVQCGGWAISKAFTTGRSYVTAQSERQWGCWFFHNAHTRTGNRLLHSAQPPTHLCFWMAAFLTLTQSWDSFFAFFSLYFFFEDFAATDLASTYAKNYNTFFPTMRLISSREFFQLLKPLKRFHTLLSSLYKSSVEEDSRRSDILQPDSNANSLLQKLALVCAQIFQNADESLQSTSDLAQFKDDLAFGK